MWTEALRDAGVAAIRNAASRGLLIGGTYAERDGHFPGDGNRGCAMGFFAAGALTLVRGRIRGNLNYASVFAAAGLGEEVLQACYAANDEVLKGTKGPSDPALQQRAADAVIAILETFPVAGADWQLTAVPELPEVELEELFEPVEAAIAA